MTMESKDMIYDQWYCVKKKPVVVSAKRIQEEFICETLEGNMKGNPGDILIKGVNNEYYPCKPEIFDKTYLIMQETEGVEGIGEAAWANPPWTKIPWIT